MKAKLRKALCKKCLNLFRKQEAEEQRVRRLKVKVVAEQESGSVKVNFKKDEKHNKG